VSGCSVQYTYENETGCILEPHYERDLGKRGKEKYIRAGKARIRVKQDRKERQKAKGKSVDRGHTFG